MPNYHNYMKSVVQGNRKSIMGATLEHENTKAVRKSLEDSERISDSNPIDKSISDSYTEVKLSLLLLTYVYSQDDQVISKKEKKDVVKMLNQYKFLDSNDYIEIFSYMDSLPTLSYVLQYISKHNISDIAAKNAYSNVYRHMKHVAKYESLLKEFAKYIK